MFFRLFQQKNMDKKQIFSRKDVSLHYFFCEGIMTFG